MISPYFIITGDGAHLIRIRKDEPTYQLATIYDQLFAGSNAFKATCFPNYNFSEFLKRFVSRKALQEWVTAGLICRV